MTPDDSLPLVTVLTSPKAGRGDRQGEITKLVKGLEASHYEVLVTENLRHLNERIRFQIPRGPSVIVAAGGDGTVGLAASQWAVNDSDFIAGDRFPTCGEDGDGGHFLPVLVPMPMGTENLLARHYGYRAEADAVFETIVQFQKQPMDLGMVGTKPFLCMATCGFDAEVVRAMHLNRRGHIRRIDYAKPLLRAMQRYRFPPIRIEPGSMLSPSERFESIECGWAMVFNLPRYAASLGIEPDAVADDGLLDVIAFKGRSLFGGIKYVLGILSGRHHRFADVVRFRTRSLRVTSPQRVPYQVDGDYGGRLPVELSVLPGAITLLRPAEKSTEESVKKSVESTVVKAKG